MKPRQPSSSLRTSQVPIPAEWCFWKMRGARASAAAPLLFPEGVFFCHPPDRKGLSEEHGRPKTISRAAGGRSLKSMPETLRVLPHDVPR
jgi:hypothetical protein